MRLRNGVTSDFVPKIIKVIDSSIIGSVVTNVIRKLLENESLHWIKLEEKDEFVYLNWTAIGIVSIGVNLLVEGQLVILQSIVKREEHQLWNFLPFQSERRLCVHTLAIGQFADGAKRGIFFKLMGFYISTEWKQKY